MNYQVYLNSAWWKHRRGSAIFDAKHKCQQCGFADELDVHHLNYDNLWAEREKDLLVFCRRCHLDLHYFEDYQEISEQETKKIKLITQDEYEKRKAIG